MSKENKKKNIPSEYFGEKRFENYMKDLENPPNPDWKPQSYEWLELKAIDKEFWKYPPCPWEKRVIDASEAGMYEVEVKVQEVLGTGVCPYGHKPGDSFIFEGDSYWVVKSSSSHGGLCQRAFPRILIFAWGGTMGPGDQDYGRGEQDNWMKFTCCPEVQSPVFFQLKRIKKKKPYDSPAPWMDIVKRKSLEYMKD
ncbi:MAG: TIGR04076 family protein [Candidatus Hodarchaeota archaeon]